MTTKIAGIYWLTQAIAGLAWWILLFIQPNSRSWFLPQQFPDQVLTSLVGADMLLFVGGSGLASWFVFRKSDRRMLICTFVVGATAYATLMSWGWLISTGQATSSAIAMTLALVGSGFATWGSSQK